MKRLYILLTAILLTSFAWAQAPQKMSYQAVVRDAANALMINQEVGIQISLLQGSVSGDAVYVETQAPTTNDNGLFSIEIGAGAVISGSLTTIDWSKGPYFIQTETDPTGGTNYTITGNSELLSVPYALYAQTAKSITGEITVTETDPLFSSSIASSITATDTAKWNESNTAAGAQLDSAGIATMGYVAGPKTIDTKLDETAVDAFVANNGYLIQEKDSSVTNEIELPTGGNSGQILSTDGSGTYSWIDSGAGGLVADAINDGTTTVAPSQNAVFDGLALKAPLASPTFTGTPVAPTASDATTNTTQIATTAFVQSVSGGLVADAINDGTTGVAPSQNTVFDGLALKAPIADAIFTGTPTAPTAASGTNTTQIATTAFVTNAVAVVEGLQPGTATGQINYWNGTAWVSVAPGASLSGNQAPTLILCRGIPTWGTCSAVVPNLSSTTAASSVTTTTASIGGVISDSGGASVTARGVAWGTSTNPTISGSYTTNGTGTGTFTSSITGLNAGTKYYVRSYATNSIGTAYGTEVSFTTPISVPTLNTTDASSITTTTASSGGAISDSGGASVTARGVAWGTSTNPTISGSYTTNGTGTGTFTSSITGLSIGTTYYVRSYATNSAGTAYGTQVSFTTSGVFGGSTGDTYQGGIVFYILQSGDPGYVSGEVHGLIAATDDQDVGGYATNGYVWCNAARNCNNRNYILAGTVGQTAIGTGLANTNTIIEKYGELYVEYNGAMTSYSAYIARNYSGGGYNDWYLPSKDELNLLVHNGGAINNLTAGQWYWSSTETQISGVWIQLVGGGSPGYQGEGGKNGACRTRAIRSF